jgi:hypothetical protein
MPDLPVMVDPLLLMHAAAHDDLEKQRIASENRLRILTTTEPDADGEYRGFGLDMTDKDVARLAGITQALAKLEHDAELGLRTAMRRSAIHPWVKRQQGLGDKQVARLLAAIGDPYWNQTENKPRTVSQLWAYCGMHVVKIDGVGQAARRRKGIQANWSTEAKTRAWLVAVSCVKVPGAEYRQVYLDRRAHTATTHPDWTLLHSHHDGLRVTAKAVLKGLWCEARRLHEVAETER